MSPLLVRAMRRLAGYAVVLTIGLVLVFKVLPAFGLLGPTATEEIEATTRALGTAKVYGAEAGLPSLEAAQAGLKHARELLAAGHSRSAKQAALEAREQAARRLPRGRTDDPDGPDRLRADVRILVADPRERHGQDPFRIRAREIVPCR